MRERLELLQLAHHAGQSRLEPVRLGRQLGEVHRLHRAFAVLHPREARDDRVIIGHCDGVELVIVAARTMQREPEERAGRRGREVVQIIRALVCGEHGVGRLHDVRRAADDEACGLVRAERVTRELLGDEPVVGHVAVERADDPVAIRPGILARAVRLVTVALRESHDIQPVPRPPLAEVRRGEEPVHHSADCRLPIADLKLSLERQKLLGHGRQADGGEVESANQRACIGWRRERQPFLRKLGSKERINGMADRSRRHHRPLDRLPSPMLRVQARAIIRPLRPLVDPRAQQADLLRRERLAFRRHLHVGHLTSDEVD